MLSGVLHVVLALPVLCVAAHVMEELLQWLWQRRAGRINPSDRAVLVTGCDSGFGRLAALALRRRGFTVYAGCLTPAGCESLAREPGAAAAAGDGGGGGGGAALVPCRLDVTKDADVEAVVATIRAGAAPLWAVLNVAGVQLGALAEWSSQQQFEDSVQVNYLGLVRVTQAVLPLLKHGGDDGGGGGSGGGSGGGGGGGARIVNVTSVNGLVSLPGIACYAASKHAAEAYTDCLRWELRPWGVHVATVNPGTFATPMLARAAAQLRATFDGAPAAVRAAYGERYAEAVCGSVARVGAVAGDPATVTRALEDAVLSKAPRDRYLVGYDAHCFWIWVWRLPRAAKDLALHLAVRWALPRPAALTATKAKGRSD